MILPPENLLAKIKKTTTKVNNDDDDIPKAPINLIKLKKKP
jgi:hypothetical protein